MKGGGKTVNQDHYVIFETRILLALFAISEFDFYKNEASRRINLLKEYYQLYVDRFGRYYFIRGGAPHYYYIDIYSTRLSFFDENGNLLHTDEQGGRDFNDSLMSGMVPKKTAYVKWSVFTDYYNVDFGLLNMVSVDRDEYAFLDRGTYEVGGNGMLNGLTIINDTRSDKSRITISNSFKMVSSSDAIFGVELNNLSGNEFPLSIALYDKAGNAVVRTLPNLMVGKNLVVFSSIGCKENSDDSLRKRGVCSYSLRVLNTEQNDVKIELGETILFDNSYSLYDYLSRSDFKLNFGNR